MKLRTINNAVIQLGDIDDSGKGRKFVSKFIQPGLVKIEGHGIVLLKKETLDASLPTIVGSPVIIQHKDVTEENANELRCGVIANAYFNQPDGWYYVDGIIWDDKAQDLINKGWSVSCSYDYLAFNDEGGEENNIHYDKEFTQLNFTHLAIVDNPRYERANIVFNSKVKSTEVNNEDQWITIHPNGKDAKGKHLLLKDGETPKEAIERTYGNGEKSDTKDKESYDKAKGRAQKALDLAKKTVEGKELSKQEKDWLNSNKSADELSKDKQSDSGDKHGFKKDKDSGYYMKDLSDGTSVYVEKKEGGQGEKEPFYLEATHFDKDGKEIAKKQYHYDSMDGMFGKIDKDFVSKDNQSDTKSKYDNLAEAQREIRKQGEMKRNLSEASQQVKEAKEHNTEKLINRLNSENFGKWVHVDEPYKLSNLEEEIDTVVRRAYKNYNGNTPPIESIYSGIQNLLGKTSVFSQERNSADFKNKLKKVEDKINKVMKEAEGYNKFDNGKWIKNKTNNSKEQDMAIIEELKKLIFKVENQKENKMDSKSKILSILNEKEVDKETIEEIKNELEKIEEKEEDKKVENEDDKEEDKVDNESEEDKEKAEDLKEEEKKDVDNKCKNSKEESYFDKLNKIYNSAKKIESASVDYEDKQTRLDAGKEYFG